MYFLCSAAQLITCAKCCHVYIWSVHGPDGLLSQSQWPTWRYVAKGWPVKWPSHLVSMYEWAQFVTWSSWSAVLWGKNYTIKQRQQCVSSVTGSILSPGIFFHLELTSSPCVQLRVLLKAKDMQVRRIYSLKYVLWVSASVLWWSRIRSREFMYTFPPPKAYWEFVSRLQPLVTLDRIK